MTEKSTKWVEEDTRGRDGESTDWLSLEETDREAGNLRLEAAVGFASVKLPLCTAWTVVSAVHSARGHTPV